MKKEIIIKDIDVFDDVTMGKVIFRMGEHKKFLKCLWRTLRVRNKVSNNRMARGTFPITYKPRAGFLPALVVRISTQTTVGMLPYRHTTWEQFGNEIYLLNYDESVMAEDDYRTLVRILFDYGADTITLQDEAKDREHAGENFLINKTSVWEGWK